MSEQVSCPVCDWKCAVGERFCPNCGWELKSDSVLDCLTQHEQVVYQKRLAAARNHRARLLRERDATQCELAATKDDLTHLFDRQQQLETALAEQVGMPPLPETREQQQKALDVLKKHAERQDVPVEQAKAGALSEIATFGLTTKEGLLRTQINITDRDGKRLYHIEANLIGENLSLLTPKAGEHMQEKQEGWFIQRSGVDYTWLVPRHTLWQYAYFHQWEWYVLVEGHWYPISSPVPTLIVSQQGEEHYRTIGEAIQSAQHGTQIIVRPGIYNEGLIIDKPLSIIGDGPVEDIVIESTDSVCILMQTSHTVVRGLTLCGRAGTRNKEYRAVDIPQGQLVLEDCDITSDSHSCVAIFGITANPVIRQCRIHDGKKGGIHVYENGQGMVEDCDIFGNTYAGVSITQGGNPVIRQCKIRNGEQACVYVYENGTGTVEECDIFDNTYQGVSIRQGGNPVIRQCKINRNGEEAVWVYEDGAGSIENCDLTDNAFGALNIEAGCHVRLSGNSEDVPTVPGATAAGALRPERRTFNLVSSLPPPPSNPFSLDAVRPAVGYVAVQQKNGKQVSGTGFVVAPQGYFLTAYHVVEQETIIRVRLEAEPQREIPAKLVGWDVKADLAVLRLADGKYLWFPLAERGYKPQQAEKVGVLSYPLGEALGREVTFTDGSVGSLRQKGNVSLIQVNADVAPGSSGGPLFRLADFRVIGVICSGIETASGLNFAVSIEEVYRRFALEQ